MKVPSHVTLYKPNKSFKPNTAQPRKLKLIRDELLPVSPVVPPPVAVVVVGGAAVVTGVGGQYWLGAVVL